VESRKKLSTSILLSVVPKYARLRVPLRERLRLEVGVAESHNTLNAPLGRYVEERAQICLSLFAFGLFLEARTTAYVHPA
jgi:hypothetical protein